jgi:hypothetical protein
MTDSVPIALLPEAAPVSVIALHLSSELPWHPYNLDFNTKHLSRMKALIYSLIRAIEFDINPDIVIEGKSS